MGLLRLCLSVSVALCAVAQASDLTQAESRYQHTDFEGSLALLDKHSNDAATNFLIARNHFMLGDFKKATDYLQQAIEEQPNNSDFEDWLGRAYGKRAETGNPLLAPSLASHARDAFEKAVALDPKNRDAMSDLFDYYLEAPGFLGGGYDKAKAIADRTESFDPPQAYFEKAKLAQKHKEFDSAEHHLRQAVAVAPHSVGEVIALARFLANQGRNVESDALFMEARAKHPNSPQVLFEWASVLIKQKRDLPEAKTMLEKYLQASITPDDPPKTEAKRLLKEAGGA